MANFSHRLVVNCSFGSNNESLNDFVFSNVHFMVVSSDLDRLAANPIGSDKIANPKYVVYYKGSIDLDPPDANNFISSSEIKSIPTMENEHLLAWVEAKIDLDAIKSENEAKLNSIE